VADALEISMFILTKEMFHEPEANEKIERGGGEGSPEGGDMKLYEMELCATTSSK
jgi:hypothetical protein